MSEARPDPRDTLAAWRGQGADRLDPVRFRFIEALAQRAERHDGKARDILDARLGQLIDAYRGRVDAEAARQVPATSAAPESAAPGEPPRLALAALRERLASLAPAENAERRAAYPELAWLDDFRKTWSRLSALRQLRHSQALIPDNAGPLNSNQLVHGALTLMQQQAPEYLQHFLSYVDALSWMEQLQAAATPGTQEAGGGAAPAKPKKKTRGKTR